MRKIIALLLLFFIVYSDNIAFAESSVEVIDEPNLPPPMVVTYDVSANVPAPVAVSILPYEPEKAPAPQTPPQEKLPAVTPAPDSKPLSDIAGDYKRGSVYGPNLSARELRQVKEKVTEIVESCIRDGMTDSEKLVALTNYLCDHCSYAADWSKNRASSAWGALVYGEAQCSGYARVMKALCDAAGVGCYYVHASNEAVNPSHQWNVVRCEGQWYHLDVQMIDSSYSGSNKPIVLTAEHMPYSTKGVPQTSGSDRVIQ